MAVIGRLIHKSAYVRMQTGQVTYANGWNARIERGLVRVSTIIRLEIGFSARTGESGRMIFEVPPLSLMSIERLTPSMKDRAWGCRCCLLTVVSTARRRSQIFSSLRLRRRPG